MARESIDVEALLWWAYQRQQVDRMEAAASAVTSHRQRSGAGFFSVYRNGLLGCTPDSSRAFGGSLAVHADAEEIHGTVTALPKELRRLVLQHAKAGTRPDWREGARATWVPRLGWRERKGERWGKCEYDDQRREWFCPLVVLNTADELAAVRTIYTAWHGAVAEIAGHYRSRPQLLTSYRVVGFAAPARPWDGNENRNPGLTRVARTA